MWGDAGSRCDAMVREAGFERACPEIDVAPDREAACSAIHDSSDPKQKKISEKKEY